MNRRGIALIIAVVILTGLLLLGLPFLFTQSSSLSGTHTFVHGQVAHIGQDSAESVGIGIVATALSNHLEQPADSQVAEDWTSIYYDLNGGIDPEAHLIGSSANRIGLNLTSTTSIPYNNPSNAQGALLGTVIEDEAGKLDPNHLDAISWSYLLSAANITDVPGDATAPTGYAGSGSLAQALAALRYDNLLIDALGADLQPPVWSTQTGAQDPRTFYQGGRIRTMEQLMMALPVGSNARSSLTDTELEHLRPFLTFFNHGQARGAARQADPGFTLYGAPVPANSGQLAIPGDFSDLALVDLGTVIAPPGTTNGGWLDSLPPSSMLAFPDPAVLVGSGTALIAEEKLVNSSGSQQIEHVMSGSATSTYTSILQQGTDSVGSLGVGWPIGIDIPAGVNMHQATPAVLTVLNSVNAPIAPPAGESTPSPDGLGSPNGLSMPNPNPASGTGPWMFHSANDFNLPGGSFTPAFTLLNPLSSRQPLCTSQLLPSQNSDVPGNATQPANGILVTSDGVVTNHPFVSQQATTLRIQGGALSMLPPTGWAFITGQTAVAQGAAANEYITYSGIIITNATTSQATLTGVARAQTYTTSAGNVAFAAAPLFSDTLPASLPAGGEANPIRPSITFFSPHELPPLAIASHGMVTIDSSSTVTDRIGNQDAQHARRIVTQAVPQESLLEERWQTQAELHALIASRQGSLLTSFPIPYPRISDDLPVDPDPSPQTTASAAIGLSADASVGLRPSTLRTLMSSTSINTDWALTFSGTSANFLSSTLLAGTTYNQTNNLPTTLFPLSSMTPEGLTLTNASDSALAYVVTASDHGPLLMSTISTSSPVLLLPNSEIYPRQISMWIKPTSDWSGTKVTLAEMRMPIANAGLALTGTAVASIYDTQGITQTDQRVDPTSANGPDTSQQNYWSLQYDATTTPARLVLILGNAAIEHINDYGPGIPADDPTSYYLDTRSGGTSSLSTGGTALDFLAPKRPMNRVEFHYAYTLPVNQWHLIQASFTRDTPGCQSITVDGLVGTDITKAVASRGSLSMALPGDHITLPSMVLATPLPYCPMDPATPSAPPDSAASFIPRIDILAWTPQGTGLPGLLPTRGYVRIGNEYISYESLDSTGLINCRRGQRQDADTNVSVSGGIVASQAWPGMPAHQTDDLVVPGGYRLHNMIGTLLRGGCLLAPMPVPSGDATINVSTTDPAIPGMWTGDPNTYFELWAYAGPSSSLDSQSGQQPQILIGTTLFPTLVTDPTVIRMLAPPPAAPTLVWPLRGFAEVFDSSNSPGAPARVFYYDNTTSPGPPSITQPFENVITQSTATGTFLAAAWPAPLAFTGNQPIILMLSCELIAPPGVSATDPSRYAVGSANGGILNPVQFYDQNDGRAEWLYYNCITAPPNASGGTVYYLINYSGFSWYGPSDLRNQRGIERTMGPLAINGTLLPAFPAGSRVLPVQTNIVFSGGTSRTEMVRTGDVITICQQTNGIPTYAVRVPGNDSLGNSPTGSARAQTWQAVVRYAAMDGYGQGNDPTQWQSAIPTQTSDTNNQYFAFTEEIPQVFSGPLDLLCWPCWNGAELDPYNTPVTAFVNGDVVGTPQPTTGVSGLLPFANAFATNPVPASGDDRTVFLGSPDNRATNNPAASVQPMNGVIDAVAAGSQNSAAQILSISAGAGNWTLVAGAVPWIAGTGLTDLAGVVVQADQAVFVQPYGLVQIGGEVFAYQQYINPTNGAYVPQAAQLIARSLLGSLATIHQNNEPVLVLPIGPVAPLNGTLAATYQGVLPIAGGFIDAPCVMISAPDGSSMEIAAAPRGLIAPWLRGLYNTSVPDLSGGTAWGPVGNCFPVLIGWWPRYPSALPNIESPLWHSLLTVPAQANAMLRSRTYAWAGFPIRYADSVFPGSANLGTISVLDSTIFNITALALSNGFDLHDSPAWEVPLSAPMAFTPSGTTACPFGSAFGSPQFLSSGATTQLIPTDGAELRVIWRYSATSLTPTPVQQFMISLANEANSAPTLGQAYLRCYAPAKILSVQSAR